MSKQENSNPPFRKLRGYAFDPSLSLDLDTFEINEIEYLLPWEDLEPGPVGEYLEIIDFDPTVDTPTDQGVFYKPVDLNEKKILAEGGLKPSDSNPMFHQQMVYAVAMTTIKNFEKALGRKVIWGDKQTANFDTKGWDENYFLRQYTEKLRIYPHALRDANAYYSPKKKALLFGYFKSTPKEKHIHMPGSFVFTCLSHDIIAHEVTHAILDGMNKFYNEPTNKDVLAFHEAFADIVALFQHFTFPGVLNHQIAKTRGNLESQNILGQLAQEFGNAIGGYGGLRDAIGHMDAKDGSWKRKEPNTSDYENILEPHKRGSILVAAVFDAFLNIYKRRIKDLLSIATGGSGILSDGELHPDLVKRLSKEAAKTAGHILQMCIRAIDYCPPIDITFGDFLRAIITADQDLIKYDKWNYRLAFVDAFKKRGIYPEDLKTLSIESLIYKKPEFKTNTPHFIKQLQIFLRGYSKDILYDNDRKNIYLKTKEHIALKLHEKIQSIFNNSQEFEKELGIIFSEDYRQFGINSSRKRITSNGKTESKSVPTFYVTNLRVVNRVSPSGNQINQMILSIIQTARLNILNDEGSKFKPARGKGEHFKFRGGVTLIFNLAGGEDSNSLKYVIKKDLVHRKGKKVELNVKRLMQQYQFQNDYELNGFSELEQYFNIRPGSAFGEQFSLLHNH